MQATETGLLHPLSNHAQAFKFMQFAPDSYRLGRKPAIAEGERHDAAGAQYTQRFG